MDDGKVSTNKGRKEEEVGDDCKECCEAIKLPMVMIIVITQQ